MKLKLSRQPLKFPLNRAPYLVFFHLFLATLVSLGKCQGCQVVLTVDPAMSNLTLGGAVVSPIVSPLESANPGVLEGLQGSMVANLPAPCPTDGNSLATALKTSLISTTPQTGPLLLYPSLVTVKSGQLVTLQWENVAFNVTLQGSGSTGTLEMNIVEGNVNSTSLVTPNGQLLTLVGTNGGNTSSLQITVNQGNQVSVAMYDYFVILPSAYQSTYNGVPLSGASNFTLAGSLVMKTTVGCNGVECGPYGRCTTLSDGSVGCQCQCGWTGGNCSIPSGFCSNFSSAATSTPSCPSPSSSPPSSSPASESPVPSPSVTGVCASSSQCLQFETWNTTTRTCECKPGWTGPGCGACENNNACSSYYSALAPGQNISATCGSSYNYSTETVYKAYSCNLTGTGLENIIKPGTFLVYCNTTGGGKSASPVTSALSPTTISDGSYCNVDFTMTNYPTNPIKCKASLCSFHSNQSRVECQSTSCTCDNACPYLDGVFSQIEGQPCIITCDEQTGHCVFDIKNFFVTLEAPCTNHDCQVAGYIMAEGAYTYTPDTNYNPVIAAIPLMILVIVAVWMLSYLFIERKYFGAAMKSSGNLGNNVAAAPSRLLPVDPVRILQFSEITATVPLGLGKKREILSDVSGTARSGELLGVMGPSGGGKTSLLSLLSGSAIDMGRGAVVKGSITLDGHPLSTAKARRIAYCPQQLSLLPTMTVEECIRYSALLRLPHTTPVQEIKDTIDKVIVELGLSQVAHSLVGGKSGLRGISGGELRRVAIAMELVRNPSILILDEPTTGLDSYAALQVMKTLKDLASAGRIVILSFHQPSPAMFNLLDNVFLLAEGRKVFSGPPTMAENMFAGSSLPCPDGVSIAEHMLNCAAEAGALSMLLGNTKLEDGYLVEGKVLSKSGSHNSFEQPNGSDVTVKDAESGSAGGTVHLDAVAKRPISRECAVLFWRGFTDIIRNPVLLLLHWAMALGVGLFVGLIFHGLALDISGAQNRLGAVFFSLAFFAFTSLTTTDLLISERLLVTREVRGGYYSLGSYFITKLTVDALVLRVLPVFVYSALFYPITGLQAGSVHVSLFLFTLATFALAIAALSFALSIGLGTAGQASLALNLILLLTLLMGGFFENISAIPGWIAWLHYLSPFFYGYSILAINEISNLLFDFGVAGYTAVQNVRGITFLNIVGINPSDLTRDIIILDCFWVAFLLLGLILLYWRVPRSKKLRK